MAAFFVFSGKQSLLLCCRKSSRLEFVYRSRALLSVRLTQLASLWASLKLSSSCRGDKWLLRPCLRRNRCAPTGTKICKAAKTFGSLRTRTAARTAKKSSAFTNAVADFGQTESERFFTIGCADS